MDIALALGGGGVRGIAHLGVIDCLERHGYKIRAVSGTSMGGLIGAVYAAGIKIPDITTAIKNFNLVQLYRRRPEDGPAILGHASLVEVLSELLHEATFDDLIIPFACTAVDINSSKEVYLKEGSLMDAVLATSAFPGVLPPRKVGDALLVDGAILDPVPVALARSLAPGLPVIAVALQPATEDWGSVPEANIIETAPLPIPSSILHGFTHLRIGQAMRIFAQSMDINSRMVAELRLKIDRPDVIIRPDVVRFGIFEMVNPDILVKIGVQAATIRLDEIQKAVSWRGKVNRLLRRITPIDEPTVLKKEAAVCPYTGHPEVD